MASTEETVNIYSSKYGHVQELTINEFDGNLLKTPLPTAGAIVYYAPWCPHCKEMAQDWEDLGEMFYKKYLMYAVNCEKQLDICKVFKIREYPTIKYFTKDGVIHDYKLPYNKFEFMNFICNQVGI